MSGSNDSLDTFQVIRDGVRRGLSASAAFRKLPKDQQLAIAHDSVMAFQYIFNGDGTSQPRSVQFAGDSPVIRALADKPPLPEGDTAGQRFAQSGALAGQQGSDAFTDMISRINFPKFVAGLIDGVFTAIVSSSIKQMEAYAELVKNVAKSAEQYMKDNVTENNARDYLADRYPGVLEIDLSGDSPKLKPREGFDESNMPDFQSDFGLDESIKSLDQRKVEETLVPAARRRIALDRQQLLATMVMMGVNRLVVTNGAIEASCLFELDTRDEVKRRMNQKQTSDWSAQHQSESGAEGSTSRKGSGFLWWGEDTESKSSWFTKNSYQDSSNFKVSTTRSEDSTAKVDMHAKLTGKVNVNFKSDYFPMERMVDVMQIQQIRSKTPAGIQPQPGAVTTTPGAPAPPAVLPR
jgi:hypothetical protein